MLSIPYPFHLSSAEQCRRMDERTINEFGIDGFTLMEVAGTRAADFILSKLELKQNILCVCGTGNNGGDAMVVARLLFEKGHDVTVCLANGSKSLSSDAQRNLELLRKIEDPVHFSSWEDLPPLDKYDVVVDGLLGTGLHSDVRAPYSDIIKALHFFDGPIFSMDLPSGLSADTGRIMGDAVKATYTLCFGALKAGFYLNDGFDYSGTIILCELPFPNQYRETAAYLIDDEWIDGHTNNHKRRIHKYADGILYIVAGGEGMTGAATLAAESAWAVGIGAAVLITPRGLLDIYEKNLIQMVKKPVGDVEDKFFKKRHSTEVLKLLQEKPGKLLIGPGLGRHKNTIEFVLELLQQYEGDVTIDADGLFALATTKDWKKPTHSSWILTPHPGELKSILNSDVSDGFDRLLKTAGHAKKNSVTILSKGLPSMVISSEGQAYFTSYDTRIFSRAGFGDVLSGKTAAYMVEYNNPELACALALLDGKHKADDFLATNNGNLEPLHLI